ncbi:hypothetical protein [Streptomyces sp. NPDC046821]|uniref:hypothetical protein n=1 Tax=Streptomyces sp. NPDC046821 TaxID=3154702 RepID=UPI0033F4CE38
MADYDTYGTSSHTAAELVHLISDRLGLAFTEHDSYFRGIYHRADSPGGEIEVQPNSIPGDDGESDLYAAEHPTAQILLLALTPAARASALRTQLGSVDGLVHLKHESL